MPSLNDRLGKDAPPAVDASPRTGTALIFQSEAMRLLVALIDRYATSPETVLITGPSGSGKELVARRLHERSLRKGRLLTVNVASLGPSLIESTLFGHVRGAFTGAVQDRQGVFEAVPDGTLFLDEIGELAPSMQVKFLRVLEEGQVLPLGSTQVRPVNPRIVAATNRDLRELVSRGLFREDLYFRLAVLVLHVPPLAAREDDIPVLAEHFLDELNRCSSRSRPKALRLTCDAMQVLRAAPWPGNVRELRACILRAAHGCTGPVITAQDIHRYGLVAPALGTPAQESARRPLGQLLRATSLRSCLGQLEGEAVQLALAEAAGSVADAAKLCGDPMSTFRHRMKRHGI